MVGALFGLVLLGLPQPAVRAELSAAQAAERAAQFRLRAAKGIKDVVQGVALREGEPTVTEDPGEPDAYVVRFNDGSFTVEKRSGKITSISLNNQIVGQARPWDCNLELSHQRLQRLAQDYCDLAGYGAELKIVAYQQELGDRPYWRLVFVPVSGGVPYASDHWSELECDYQTGRLVELILYPYPSPPSELTPNMDAGAARATMVTNLIGEWHRSALEELIEPGLRIWKPVSKTRGHGNHLGQGHSQLARRNRGILVYQGAYADPDSYNESQGFYARQYECYVDANTGQLLNVHELVALGSGGGKVVKKDFTWEWVRGGAAVLFGTRAASAAIASVALIAPTLGSEGLPIVLQCGKRYVSVHFDPKHRALSYQTATGPVYGRPNPELLKALQEATKKG